MKQANVHVTYKIYSLKNHSVHYPHSVAQLKAPFENVFNNDM